MLSTIEFIGLTYKNIENFNDHITNYGENSHTETLNIIRKN